MQFWVGLDWTNPNLAHVPCRTGRRHPRGPSSPPLRNTNIHPLHLTGQPTTTEGALQTIQTQCRSSPSPPTQTFRTPRSSGSSSPCSKVARLAAPSSSRSRLSSTIAVDVAIGTLSILPQILYVLTTFQDTSQRSATLDVGPTDIKVAPDVVLFAGQQTRIRSTLDLFVSYPYLCKPVSATMQRLPTPSSWRKVPMASRAIARTTTGVFNNNPVLVSCREDTR
jgi:hypothetical protein